MTDVAGAGLESAARPDTPGVARFPAFDGLRAVAALLVVATHVSFITTANRLPLGSLFARMDIGVTVFFVISGFLLHRPFAAAHLAGRPGPAVRPFLRRRFLRVVPAYWAALVLIAVVFRIHPFADLEAAVRAFTLTQVYWLERSIIDVPIGLAWTLAIEVTFYLFLPLYAAVLARRGATPEARLRAQLLGLGALYATSVAFRSVMFAVAGDTADVARHWLPANLDLFALGMLLAVGSAWWRQRPAPTVLASTAVPIASWGMAAALFAVVAYGVGLPTSGIDYTDGQHLVRQSLYGAVAFFFVLPAVFGPTARGPARALLGRPLQLAGLVSYGIYLWHEAILSSWLRWFDLRPFDSAFLPMLAGVTALALAAAAASYLLIERPSLRLKDRPT